MHYHGFLSEANIGQINAALRKARKWGLTDRNITLEDIADQSDISLFNKLHAATHCLHPLLPPIDLPLQVTTMRPVVMAMHDS